MLLLSHEQSLTKITLGLRHIILELRHMAMLNGSDYKTEALAREQRRMIRVLKGLLREDPGDY